MDIEKRYKNVSLYTDQHKALEELNTVILEYSEVAQNEYFANLATSIENSHNPLATCLDYFNTDYMDSISDRPVFRKLLARYLSTVFKDSNTSIWNKYI